MDSSLFGLQKTDNTGLEQAEASCAGPCVLVWWAIDFAPFI